MAGQGYQVGKSFSVSAALNTTATLNPSISNAATGGTVPAGTYYMKYTWVSANGESAPFHSSEPSTTTSGSTSTLTCSNPYVPANYPSWATGWNLYVGTASGQESLQATVTGTSTYTITSPLVQGKGLPSWHLTSFIDINPSAIGLATGSEFIIHNLYYNNPVAFAIWDGTTLVPFDGDTGNGARQDLYIHCNANQWLRVYNNNVAFSLQVSFDGIQTQ